MRLSQSLLESVPVADVGARPERMEIGRSRGLLVLARSSKLLSRGTIPLFDVRDILVTSTACGFYPATRCLGHSAFPVAEGEHRA